MEIKIKNLKYDTPDKIVTEAEWEATVTEGYQIEDALDEEGNLLCPGPYITSYIERAYGTQSFNRDENSPEFIPYEDLTEANVISWLTLDEGLEANLLAKIEEQKTPSTVTGIPWE